MGFIDFVSKSIKKSVKTNIPDGDFSGFELYGAKYKKREFNLRDEFLYAKVKESDLLTLVFKIRKEEVFRNGYTIEKTIEKSELKILEEKLKIENEKENEELNKEDINKQIKDLKKFTAQKKTITELIKKCNEKGVGLIDELKLLQYDLDVTNKCFLFVGYEYSKRGSSLYKNNIFDIRRVKTHNIKQMVDKKDNLGYDEDGNKIYFSVFDRGKITFDTYDKKNNCPNIRAFYCIKSNTDELFYGENEIIQTIINDGESYIYSVLDKVDILKNIDQSLLVETDPNQKKNPNKLLMVPTNNAENLRVWWANLSDSIKKNPKAVHPVPYNSKEQIPVVIDLGSDRTDQQRLDLISDFWNKVGSIYGVSPIFQNDMSTGGGLNNEGLQIKITNRAIEDRQNIFNDKIIPEILRKVLEEEDLCLKMELNPSEEEDEAHEEQLLSMRLENAQLLLNMGVKVEITKDNKLVYDASVLEKPEENPFSGGFEEMDENKDGVVNEEEYNNSNENEDNENEDNENEDNENEDKANKKMKEEVEADYGELL